MLQEWALAKYARYIEGGYPPTTTAGESDKAALNKGKGTWQHFTSTDDEPLKLVHVQTSHLVITKGKIILENHQLLLNPGRLRGVGKGDSILFLTKLQQDEERRFRVRFSQQLNQDTETSCRQCVEVLSNLMAIEYMGLTQRNSGMKEVHISNLARQVLERPSLGELSQVYNGVKMDDQEINAALQLCLTDSTFPDFVQQVENSLKKLTSSGDQLGHQLESTPSLVRHPHDRTPAGTVIKPPAESRAMTIPFHNSSLSQKMQ